MGKFPGHVVTNFLEARAMVVAAELSRSIDPFPWETPHGDSLLAHAHDLLEECRAQAVGGFFVQCDRRWRAARSLFTELTRQAG